MSEENITYLGDAVYAEFDGGGVWLRTGHHKDKYSEDNIYLENEVIKKLFTFINVLSSGKKLVDME